MCTLCHHGSSSRDSQKDPGQLQGFVVVCAIVVVVDVIVVVDVVAVVVVVVVIKLLFRSFSEALPCLAQSQR